MGYDILYNGLVTATDAEEEMSRVQELLSAVCKPAVSVFALM